MLLKMKLFNYYTLEFIDKFACIINYDTMKQDLEAFKTCVTLHGEKFLCKDLCFIILKYAFI